jgi:hypothetical protein
VHVVFELRDIVRDWQLDPRKCVRVSYLNGSSGSINVREFDKQDRRSMGIVNKQKGSVTGKRTPWERRKVSMKLALKGSGQAG